VAALQCFFLAAFSGVNLMRAGPLKSGVHLFLLTNITCTEFFQTYRFNPKGLQQHPQNGSVGQRKAIKFRQIDRFSYVSFSTINSEMDSPWRLGQYSPSSACEVAPPISLDLNVRCPCALGLRLLACIVPPFHLR
jgi:hypothetical protein